MDSVVGLKHGVNRVRSMNHQPIVAYWSENGDIMIANLKPLMDKYLNDTEDDGKPKKSTQYNINQLQHRSFANSNEGYALDWSPI